MGTLTADQPRLPGYCDHKLPTSCRLSSIPHCCACADERAHASSYSTYIDGIGFVPRGNRWQRYCWFCKEFWENRVQASGLRPAQTRIPEVPDQTEFLERWYEFHRGYRLVSSPDGTEERVAVLGEEFREVSPGVLPRTVEEMRAGREQSELAEREARQRAEDARQETVVAPTGPSLEQALDQLIEAAGSEEEAAADETRADPSTRAELGSRRQDPVAPRTSVHAQAMNPTGDRNSEYQARRVAALRRELHRMRNGIERVISGLRHLGEIVPDYTETTSRLVEMGRTLDNMSGNTSREGADDALNNANTLTNLAATGTSRADRTLAGIQARVDEARRIANEARVNRDRAASELDIADQELRTSQARLRQLQSEQRTAEGYSRLFGTREEIIAQGENYESPIGGMFTRAWERFRVAEEVRREERTLRQVIDDEDIVAGPGGEDLLRRLDELQSRERDVWGVPRSANAQIQRSGLQGDERTTTGGPPLANISGRGISGNSGNNGENPDLVGLEEYHNMLQGQTQSETGSGSSDTLSGIDLMQRNQNQQPQGNGASDVSIGTSIIAGNETLPQLAIVGGPPGHQLDPDPFNNNDRGLDALFVIRALLESETLQTHSDRRFEVEEIRLLQHKVEENSLEAADGDTIESFLDNELIIWGCGLPAERNRRRRQRGEIVTFTPDAYALASGGQVIVHDIEMMAECFQMSHHVRDRSALTPPGKLRLLYRLQRGERTTEDRDILVQMLRNESTLNFAQDVHSQVVGEQGQESSNRQAALDRDRQENARRGDHSRAELDSSRRATQAFALAASTMAMRTGPTALLERMASRDDETRAAYQRLQENGFVPARTMTERIRETLYRPLSLNDFTASPSATDSDAEEDDEARGLDAKDSGRPAEPMTDEDMTIKLDCRICYSQLADVACLPCGHLVMCKWCSEQHSPVATHDRTRPRRAAGCPVCRKGIRQKVRVFRA